MEQIPLMKTKNLGIIEGSILDCRFDLYNAVPNNNNMCLYCSQEFGSQIKTDIARYGIVQVKTTVKIRSLKNTKILRFVLKNLFHGAWSTLQRKTQNLIFNDSWWILMCRWISGPCFNSWSNKLETRGSDKTMSNYVTKLLAKTNWCQIIRNLVIMHSLDHKLSIDPWIRKIGCSNSNQSWTLLMSFPCRGHFQSSREAPDFSEKCSQFCFSNASVFLVTL